MSGADLCLHLTGCGACGHPLPKGRRRWCSDRCRNGWYINHLWSYARPHCLHRSKWVCLGCGVRATEVDHIIERHGVPIAKPSCMHHQRNLRALCHDCHVHRRDVFHEVPSGAGRVPSTG